MGGKTVNKSAESEGMSYGFHPTADPGWDELSLHASVEFTGSTGTAVESTYTWEIVPNPSLSHHHRYVPDGLTVGGIGNLGDVCPEDAPGSTYTQAGDHDMTNPPADTDLIHDTAVYTNPASPFICDVHPEKCGGDPIPSPSLRASTGEAILAR